MRAVLVSRFPRVDTPAWKRQTAESLASEGMDIAVLYSRSHLVDHAAAGLREEGLGVVRRYAELRPGGDAATRSEPQQTLAAWAEERGMPVIRARRLGSAGALDALRRLRPGIVVLLGADIVPTAMLAIPETATINPHYGLLPAYRGMNVTEWSLFNGDPVGVSVHVVDAGIDTGDILLREEISLEPGDTLASLRVKHQQLAARLLVKAAVSLRDGTARPLPQRPEDGRQYYRMHPLLRRIAASRLAAQAGARG